MFNKTDKPSSSAMIRLDALIRQQHQVSWNKARDWIDSGKIWLEGRPVTDPSFIVSPQTTPELKMNALRNNPHHKTLSTSTQLIYVDSQIIVINKPSGISTVPYAPEEREKQSKNLLINFDSIQFIANILLSLMAELKIKRFDRP